MSWELMQFTGLHDKNGKEIYEGDLLRSKKGIVSEVYWSEKYARFSVRYRNAWKSEPRFIFKSLMWGQTGEIVGNIYENENLLTQS